MTILEIEVKKSVEAAGGRFFISREARASSQVISLMNGLGELKAISFQAGAQLREISLEDMAEFDKQQRDYINRRGTEGSVPELVARINQIIERAPCYDDACSVIQRAGMDLASEVQQRLPSSHLQVINGYPYWLETDRQERQWLCTVDLDDDSAVYFNRFDESKYMTGRAAGLNDYIALINNVEQMFGNE